MQDLIKKYKTVKPDMISDKILRKLKQDLRIK